jgi:hypothetical protein
MIPIFTLPKERANLEDLGVKNGRYEVFPP